MDTARWNELTAENARLRAENAVLRAENTRLTDRVKELSAQVDRLTAQVDKLTAALDQARREGKRQAAPFRKPPKSSAPKKPGRKPGENYGQHHRKAVPTPEQVTERHQVSLPECCDCCHSKAIERRPAVVQYQVEIPNEPIVREFTIETGRCQRCGKTVRGRHELQTSNATGAAAVQWGPRTHAAMAWANKILGLTHGKIAKFLDELFKLRPARGTSARSAARSARRCAAAYEQAKQDVRNSPQVVPDETGWRVGGGKAWLHAFAGLNEVVYAIDPTRGGQPAEELLGLDYAGLMTHDGWSTYNAFTQATHQQCTAHLINRCKEMLQTATASAARFPREVIALLRSGLAFRDRFLAEEVTPRGCAIVAGQLTNRLLCLVGIRKQNAANERLAKFLFDHTQSIFNYLRHPGMDATNWRGEHAIRYGVVNRKVWGGNRTWPGAVTQSVLMTVLTTCAMRSHSAVGFLMKALTSPTQLSLPPPRSLALIHRPLATPAARRRSR